MHAMWAATSAEDSSRVGPSLGPSGERTTAMSYLAPIHLATEHQYRTERLTRSWGAPLLRAAWAHHPVRLRGRTAPARQARPARPVADHRQRVLVPLR